MCIHLRSFFTNSLNINQGMFDLKIAFSTLLLVFNNKAEKTTKLVGLLCFIIAGLLFSSLYSYCKTNGELKSPSRPLCNYVFMLYFRLLSKSSINVSLMLNIPVVFLNEACSSAAISALQCFLFFLLLCLLYVVCALLVPFLLINRVLRSRRGGRGGGSRGGREGGGRGGRRKRRRITGYPRTPIPVIAI